MGTVDIVAQIFDEIEPDFEHSTKKMVNIKVLANTEVHNEAVNKFHNGFTIATDPLADSQQESEDLLNNGNLKSRKRELSPDTNSESTNKKSKSQGEDSSDHLENTGRGKRIRKPSKRCQLYEDYKHQTEHIRELSLKKLEQRHGTDVRSKPLDTSKSSRKNTSLTDSSVHQENGQLTDSINSSTSSSVPPLPEHTNGMDANEGVCSTNSVSLKSDFLQQPQQCYSRKKSNIKEEMRVTNENGEVESLTIIDITNSDNEAQEEEEDNEQDDDASEDLLERNSCASKESGVDSYKCQTQQDDASINTVSTCGDDKDNSYSEVESQSSVGHPLPCSVVDRTDPQEVSQSIMVTNIRIKSPVMNSVKASPHKPLIFPKMQPSEPTNNYHQHLHSNNIKPESKPQKKVFKKPLKKKLQKKNKLESRFDDSDFNEIHLSRLKSVTAKKLNAQKQEKGSDSGGTTKSSVGPYVQCKGRKDSLKLCKVINIKDSSDADHISSGPNRCGVLPSEACKPQGSSRVSENVPWKCVFCSRGTSHMSMGDLFGPYFPQQQLLSSNTSLSSLPNVNSKKSLLKTEKGSSTAQQFSSSSQLLPNGLPAEMWVHCDCAVWTNGIFVAGGRLLGLEEAALAAQHSMCCKCREKGATLGCFVKGCELKYHYLCACDAGCTLQEENFSILCPKHKTRPVRAQKTTASNQEPPVVLL